MADIISEAQNYCTKSIDLITNYTNHYKHFELSIE